ncbi:MAG: HAD-IC family P-type ATPase [Bacteroidales bacterium]|nr:HAD-IC family P-type ATPase [Bacteroidales bacterium]MDD3330442.1 HAD-IC family P-type ATPase [Bacteroidales bacterium]
MKHQASIAEEHWQSIPEEKIFKELETSKEGLAQDEASARLQFYGLNKLPEGKKVTLIQIILHQLINPLIFILVLAAVASVAIGEGKDAIFIFLVIFINSALGSYQEYKAEKSASSLQKMMKIKARVRRNAKDIELPSENLVPGDIVLLESGMKVPADLRLLEVSGLEIDESFLTGESITAKKQTKLLQETLGIAERTNMAFAGATVMKGRGMGVVVCTGIDTQVGKISQNVSESKSAKPPLVLRMEKFIKQISILILLLSVVLGIMLRIQGQNIIAIFFLVVALAVSAIPEGLPVALTVALSIATKRMAKRNVIVRKLNSVESLGSCTVIASDKTGTLTVNEQTAKLIVLSDGTQYNITGEGYNGEGNVIDAENNIIDTKTNDELSRIARIAVFANEGSLFKENEKWIYHGDAMDVALLGMAYKLGIDPMKWQTDKKPVGKIPYESERKFSASFCNINASIYIGVKGAVETILEFCDSMSIHEEVKVIDKNKILSEAETLAKNGYRVLAFASGEYKDYQKKETYENEDIPVLTFYGLVGFIDPLRAEAKTSVKECAEAGIKVIMITGDHPETAGTIAQELGIADKNTPVINGQMLAESGTHDSPAFEKLVTSSTVFARVSPTQKLEIVDVLIRKGEYVAVTGDGVNDAPALKRANIGVAMGSGTDVAKEVGSMIVVDDNFSSIVAGIEEGRFAYDNVRKVIYLLISTGAAEIILFLLAVSVGLPLPLLAVQLLWLNLVTNGIQDVALAFEGGEPGAMKRPPRKPSEKIFNPLMIKQTLTAGLTMGLIVFGFWYYLINIAYMQETHARVLILLLMVFMQNFHAFNARSERVSTFKVPLKRNILLVFGVIAAQGLHILSMQIPVMQNVLSIEPITFIEWLYILALAIPMILVMEVFKWIQKQKIK